jgi:2-hydroxychromene-2-carboxylate isomerase
MDDPAVVRATLELAGLPAERLLELTQDAGVKAELIANTEDAVAHGVFGSPSFRVGSELFFGKDKLRDVEEEIAAQRA